MRFSERDRGCLTYPRSRLAGLPLNDPPDQYTEFGRGLPKRGHQGIRFAQHGRDFCWLDTVETQIVDRANLRVRVAAPPLSDMCDV